MLLNSTGVRINFPMGPGSNLFNALECSMGARYVVEGKIMMQCFKRWSALKAGCQQKRLYFRREPNQTGLSKNKKWFYAEGVTHQVQNFVVLVPCSKCIHSVDFFYGPRHAIPFDKLEDDLRIRSRLKLVDERILLGERFVVVEFRVGHQVYGTGDHRLPTCTGTVEDAQPSMGETTALISPHTCIIRSTMYQ